MFNNNTPKFADNPECIYDCAETQTSIHYIKKEEEWWVSDTSGIYSNQRRGYLTIHGMPEKPPDTTTRYWELWIGNDGNYKEDKVTPKLFQISPFVYVNYVGEDEILIHVDEREIKNSCKFSGDLSKICGLYVKRSKIYQSKIHNAKHK